MANQLNLGKVRRTYSNIQINFGEANLDVFQIPLPKFVSIYTDFHYANIAEVPEKIANYLISYVKANNL